MRKMNQDLTLAALFLAGTWGFITGQFIISTVLFAGAAIYSNISFKKPAND